MLIYGSWIYLLYFTIPLFTPVLLGLWYSSLGSHVSNLPNTSNYFAKTSRQNNDFFRPQI